MEQNEKIGYKDIFKQKEYMKMMVAALINRFGDSIDAIASTWIVYELTGSAVWSAVIFGVNKVPSVCVTPLAGAGVEDIYLDFCSRGCCWLRRVSYRQWRHSEDQRAAH